MITVKEIEDRRLLKRDAVVADIEAVILAYEDNGMREVNYTFDDPNLPVKQIIDVVAAAGFAVKHTGVGLIISWE